MDLEALLEIGIGTEATFNETFESIRAWLDWLPEAQNI